MSWELDNKGSIYGQLIRTIRQRILTGYYPPGSRIDSVRELAEEAGVNPNTMQRALSELEREGIVRSERTSGRFVTEDRARLDAMREEVASEFVSEYVSTMQNFGFSGEEIQDAVATWLRKER